ncbi:MAG: hypothetical protein WBL20_19260 [Sphingobium sp.]|uniref:hypothetical protein n=1 Tax=Sphingobium sp. TaxID=1912891 RepID=UPI003BB0C8C3
MTEDELDDYAEELAQSAVSRVGDVATAAAVLYQASLLLLVAHFPADKAFPALADMMEMAHADAAEALGYGETKQ